MTRRSENHKVAEIIKGLEERIADLEEKDRTIGTPNVLRTITDRVLVRDRPDTITERDLTPAKWNDIDYGSRIKGYGNTGYGVTDYGSAIMTPYIGDSNDYGEGEYAQGGYGGVEATMWNQVAQSGWGTGTWGSYDEQ